MIALRRTNEIRWAQWETEALRSALRLGLFTALGEQPLTATQLAERLDLGARTAVVTHYLDALTGLGLLERDGDRYRNGAEAAKYLDAGRPTYVGDVVEKWLGVLDLEQALRASPEESSAERFYETMSPQQMRGFLRLMTASSADVADELSRRLPWPNTSVIADIGCAEGAVAAQVLAAHPHLRAVGFDLPAARVPFDEYMAAHGLADRADFREGDFLVDPLPSADVALLVRVLHNWNPDRRQTLLRRVHEALPTGGRIVVCEAMLGDSVIAHFESLLMSIQVGGGSEFTAAECASWLADAGFLVDKAEPLTGPWSMVSGVK